MIFVTTADLQDLEEGDKEEGNDDSVVSSPLLVGGPRLVVSEESEWPLAFLFSSFYAF